MNWETKEILIYGKTYPEISTKYVETVCTGGIEKDTGNFIRLYPIPFRYLKDEKRFQKYQWIRAKVRRHSKDNRPESRQVDIDSIQTLSRVGTGKNRDWQMRKELFLVPQNIFRSLETLKERQSADGTSIGMVKPKRIIDFYMKKKKQSDYEDALKKRDIVLSQKDLFRDLRDYEVPEFKFYFEFECDDPQCNGHQLSVLDWEFYALHRKTRNDPDWFEKMRTKIMDLCDDKHETYLFLGNLADPAKRQTFCVSGIFHPPIRKQMSLL